MPPILYKVTTDPEGKNIVPFGGEIINAHVAEKIAASFLNKNGGVLRVFVHPYFQITEIQSENPAFEAIKS